MYAREQAAELRRRKQNDADGDTKHEDGSHQYERLGPRFGTGGPESLLADFQPTSITARSADGRLTTLPRMLSAGRNGGGVPASSQRILL